MCPKNVSVIEKKCSLGLKIINAEKASKIESLFLYILDIVAECKESKDPNADLEA